MDVFALPHSDSRNNHVSVDSRKGTITGGALGGKGVDELAPLAPDTDGLPPPAAILASADMHLPRVDKDLLMFAPSFRRAPVAPVALALSDPARSTSDSLESRTFV